jgi:uncharacterized iron-regulated protein
MRRLSVTFLAALVLGGAATAGQSYVPHRVFDTARGAFSDFEVMAADLAKADIVFVGEQHDDPNTHRLELAVLEALARRGRPAIVSLEMFERDVQEPLEHFLMGHMDEPEFLKQARPWPRYATDYKPLVDFAIARDWAVLAANVPRRIASEVSKGGLDALGTRPAEERALFASDLQCPIGDEYFKRFAQAMGGHPAPGTDAASVESQRTTERYYYSQCVKDETMAESVVRARDVWRGWMVVHYTGAFHSDRRLGTVERLARRLPDARIAVVSIVPVPDPATADPAEFADRGDYVVFVTAPATAAAPQP